MKHPLPLGIATFVTSLIIICFTFVPSLIASESNSDLASSGNAISETRRLPSRSSLDSDVAQIQQGRLVMLAMIFGPFILGALIAPFALKKYLRRDALDQAIKITSYLLIAVYVIVGLFFLLAYANALTPELGMLGWFLILVPPVVIGGTLALPGFIVLRFIAPAPKVPITELPNPSEAPTGSISGGSAHPGYAPTAQPAEPSVDNPPKDDL